MKKFISVILIVMMVIVLAVPIYAFSEDPAITVHDLNRVPDCNSTTKYLEDYNLAIFKKGNNFVIWTEEGLPDELHAELIEAIEACKAPGLKNLGNPNFVSGFESFKIANQDITISTEGVIQFEGKATWSWFYRGNYEFFDDHILY